MSNFRVQYHDDVSDDQIAAIERLVAPEFASGDWVTVEDEASVRRTHAQLPQQEKTDE